MKKYIILSLALFVCFAAGAQKVTSGSVAPIFQEKTLNVTFDFSQAVIDGIKESTLLNVGGERARDWQEGKEDICAKFILAMVPIVDAVITVGYYPDAMFTLVFIPKTFDDDGEVRGDANIIDKDGNVIAVISKINGDGGSWRSFMGLCEASMTKAGEKVGRLLMKEYNKAARQK